MRQRSIEAFEGHWCHIDQMWKSLDFLNFLVPQWGHLYVSDSFQFTQCLTGRIYVSKAKKSALVYEKPLYQNCGAGFGQLYLHHEHVALCNLSLHSLPHPPDPSCPGEVICRCVKVSGTDLKRRYRHISESGVSISINFDLQLVH